MRLIFLGLLLTHCSLLFSQLQNPRNTEYQWNTDTSNAIVDLSEIILVAPRNTFPSINFPKFISKKEGLNSYFKHEPVIAIELNGMAKAYPLNVLTMHEMSNDTLGGIPILPTYCPLCNSSMVYDRRFSKNGKDYLLNFEVSGMLRNSDMVMADDATQSWWQQLTGQAIVGEFAGSYLNVIPSIVISVEEFFTSYPNGLILSPNTGTKSEKHYGKNPYVGYDKIDNLPYQRYYDTTQLDSRLPPMERIVNIEGTDNYKVYPFSIINKKAVINDQFEGIDLVIFYKKGLVSILDSNDITKSRDIGSATVFSSMVNNKKLTFIKNENGFVDNETKSVWSITGICTNGSLKGEKLTPLPHSNHFAFAWLTFYPNSIIYSD